MLQTALVTLEGWINSLPPAIVRTRPGLISLRGPILAMKGNLQEANELLDSGCVHLSEKSRYARVTLALIRRAHTLRLLGKYDASLKDIEEALQLAETDLSLAASLCGSLAD